MSTHNLLEKGHAYMRLTHFLPGASVSDLDPSTSLLLLTHNNEQGHCLTLTVLELVQQLRVLLVQHLCLQNKGQNTDTMILLEAHQ